MAGDELSQFIQGILAEKQLSGIDDNVREQLVADLQQRLLDQINRALIDALPDDKIEAFNRMLDDESLTDEQVQQFIAASGVDVQRVTIQTMLRFRDLYLGDTGKANG
jgi:hypothetical protein